MLFRFVKCRAGYKGINGKPCGPGSYAVSVSQDADASCGKNNHVTILVVQEDTVTDYKKINRKVVCKPR
jgi:hypothetical protein